MKKKNVIILVGLILVAFAIIGVLFISMDKNIKLGFAGSKTGNKMNGSFQYFDGNEDKKINLSKDEIILVTYELKASEGELSLMILDADGKTLQNNVEEQGTLEFKADTEQKYTIRIHGVKAKGSYKVSWENES